MILLSKCVPIVTVEQITTFWQYSSLEYASGFRRTASPWKIHGKSKIAAIFQDGRQMNF